MDIALRKDDALELKFRTLEFKIQQLRLTSTESVVVNVHSGKIRGAIRRTIYNDEYNSFEKIPYAQEPVGDLRFRAPKPVSSWKGIRDCTTYGNKPWQKSFTEEGEFEGSEDVLHLNVYTNNLKPTKPRPVMVYIYGGGFLYGEANPEWFGPDYFMKQNVILVTVQYRYGALGFLSLADRHLHIPGNAGLKDQIMALKWIKRNIATFGGNPDCVTVFGESAGAASTQLLMLTDQCKGLFHRAIAQSGSVTSDWIPIDCGNRSYALATAAGYEGDKKERNILEYLMGCSAEDICRAQFNCLTAEDYAKNDYIAFGPTVEPYFTPHTVLHKPPVEMLEKAWGNSIPFMTGCTSQEALYMYPATQVMFELMEAQTETCTSFLPKGIVANADSPEALEKGMKLRKAHIQADKLTVKEYLDILSFFFFLHPMHKTIKSRLQHASKSATYLYRFDFDSEKLGTPYRLVRWGKGVRGASHTDDLTYLFSNLMSKPMDKNSREYATIERMTGLWTTFAETGNPNSTKVPGMKDIKWKRLTGTGEDNLKCLNISDNLKIIEMPEMAKLKVWNELYNLHRDLPKSNELVDLSVYTKSAL